MELRLWSQATSWQELVVFNTTWFTWSYMAATFSAKSLIILSRAAAMEVCFLASGKRAALLEAAEFEGKNRQDCKASLGSWDGYGSIPINTIFRGMNIHLPAILMFTRGTRFWHTARLVSPGSDKGSFWKVRLVRSQMMMSFPQCLKSFSWWSWNFVHQMWQKTKRWWLQQGETIQLVLNSCWSVRQVPTQIDMAMDLCTVQQSKDMLRPCGCYRAGGHLDAVRFLVQNGQKDLAHPSGLTPSLPRFLAAM